MTLARRSLAAALTMLLACLLLPSARADEPGRLSVLIGRGLDGTCTSPLALRFADIERMLAVHGLTGALNVVPDRVGQCYSGRRYLGWDGLAAAVGDGWAVNSAGPDHAKITRASTYADAHQLACGSTAQLEAGGLPAPVEFAYPAGEWTPVAQQAVLDCGYSFGRYYDGPASYATRDSAAARNWMVPAYSVNGQTATVASLVQAMSPDPGQWRQVQLYNVVTGLRLRNDGTVAWDCRAAEATGGAAPGLVDSTEYLCAATLDAALRQVPASVAGVTPAAVAVAWGRTSPGREH